MADQEHKSSTDEFAAIAMLGLITAGLNTDAWEDYDDLADSAYKIAEAMKRARDRLDDKA